MATATNQTLIEKIKSKRNKDKAIAEGFLYNLNRINGEVYYWVCEKRGECNARMNTRNDIVIKPVDITLLANDHTHAPSQERIEMLRAYSKIKSTATQSEQSTRTILSTSLEVMHPSIVNAFPKLESVKRSIRVYKSAGVESCGHLESAAGIILPDKYKTTLKGEPFLLFDSGFGDERRMILYATPEFLSILSKSNNWFCDGTFKIVPELFFQLYSIHAEFEGLVIPCVYALLSNKEETTYDAVFRKLLEFEPALNPLSIMVDFEKAAINALENNFISVISGCFFSSLAKYLSTNSGRRISYELSTRSRVLIEN